MNTINAVPAITVGYNVFTLHEDHSFRSLKLLSQLLPKHMKVNVRNINAFTREVVEEFCPKSQESLGHSYGYILDYLQERTGTHRYTMEEHIRLHENDNKFIYFYASSEVNSKGLPLVLLTVNHTFDKEYSAMEWMFPGMIRTGIMEMIEGETDVKITYHQIPEGEVTSPLVEYLANDFDHNIEKSKLYIHFVMGRFERALSVEHPVIVFFKDIINIRNILRSGWYPLNNSIKNTSIQAFMKRDVVSRLLPTNVVAALEEGMSGRQIKILTDSSVNLREGMYFEARSFESAKRLAIENCFSGSLKYTNPEMMYRSGRPRTDMSIFRLPFSLQSPGIKNSPHNGYVVEGGEFHYIPVTRYASGMSRGLYYNDYSEDSTEEENFKTDYKGTFYYHEPESTTFLAVKGDRYAVYFNKLHAYISLIDLQKDRRKILFHHGEYVFTNPLVYAHLIGVLPEDLKMTMAEIKGIADKKWTIPYTLFKEEMLKLPPKEWPTEVHGYLGQSETFDPLSRLDIPKDLLEDQKKYYTGHALKMYGAEDRFDQDLCHLAIKKGLDILIFTHMVGSHHVVTEVLDTRDRINSFKSLVFSN